MQNVLKHKIYMQGVPQKMSFIACLALTGVFGGLDYGKHLILIRVVEHTFGSKITP